MSYEEFLAIPEPLLAEWVDGAATIFMPPAREHQDALGLLSVLLRLYARIRGAGEVILAPFEVVVRPGRSYREPDILFVATANLHRLSSKRLDGPPDLAIELLSDDSVTRDRDVKLREYEAAGLPEYWIFDPRPGRHASYHYRLGANGRYESVHPDPQGRVHSTVLPGFWLKPEWLWEDPLPVETDLLEEILGTTGTNE
jgi:Uma2 family endonuclease